MSKARVIYLLLCFTLIITLASSIFAFQVPIIAEDATTTPTPTPTPTPAPVTLKLTSNIPSYSDDSGAYFNFDCVLEYTGLDRITVNLSNTTPPGWSTNIQYLGKQVNSIDIGPAQYGSATASFTLNLTPDPGKLPDPGDYITTLKATSVNFSPSIDLKAMVKSKISYIFSASSGRLSTSATAGEENHYTLVLTNNSSVALENISISSTKPEKWLVSFEPERIESLGTGQTIEIESIITPPSGNTIAGDYMITMRASNDKFNSSFDVRVTALTPSIWGWVGIIIVVVVIAGIVVLFFRLGRR